ncbi:MAG: hypothetical protein N3I86_16450, partial [Verrucomicrobiae bacterium]|nr:hypothetical protein [Verrucomicrobiae bacterium]
MAMRTGFDFSPLTRSMIGFDHLFDLIENAGRARVYRVRIQDRRWKWRFGQISGEYNVRRDDNQQNFLLGTARNPQQLARLCLDAMGEQNY